MSPDQALLISLLLGRALDAILVKVNQMGEDEVKQAIQAEEGKSRDLLAQMRRIS